MEEGCYEALAGGFGLFLETEGFPDFFGFLEGGGYKGGLVWRRRGEGKGGGRVGE